MKEVIEGLMADKASKVDYTLGVRITNEMRVKLEEISEKTGKTKSMVAKAILEAGLNQIELS